MIHFKSIFLLILVYGEALTAQEYNAEIEFFFGTNNSHHVENQISSKTVYTDSLGYGFDFNTAANVVLYREGFSSTFPVYFSVELPEGNYHVDLTLGSMNEATETTVKVESRRLMLDRIRIPKEAEAIKSIAVSRFSAKIDEGNMVRLKEREFDDLNWDNKLTFEFSGNTGVKSIKITPVENITTLFLAGDSTVADQDLEPWASWGQFITSYFGHDIVIANYASSGASLSSFKTRKRWAKILSLMKGGDYVLIEFGHNDQKQEGEGQGPWQNYTDLLTEFVAATRKKGGRPVLLTPTQRRVFSGKGHVRPTHGDYPVAMRAVAKKLSVPLIDLTEMTTILYESWGDNLSKKAFVQYPAHTFPGQDKALEDNTHFNGFGANEIALCVIKGIKGLKLDLSSFLIGGIPEYKPNKPNLFSSWSLPLSLRFEPVKPDGN